MPKTDKFLEVGRPGLANWGGQLEEEFLRELRGPSGVKVYREMSKNDAIIGASLFAYTVLAKEVTFRIDSASPGNNKADEVAEFVHGCLFEDMSLSWTDLLGEIFSFLTYGWSYFNVVFKRRQGYFPSTGKAGAPASSRFNDNKIGWRKWAIRGQDTLSKWDIDDHGGINAMMQRALPTLEEIPIPMNQSLLFRTTVERGNPEGQSILRCAYQSYYYKRRLQVIRGIGIERDLAGLPIITPPEGVNIWNTNDSNATTLKAAAEQIVRNIRRDEHEGVVKPHGWELTLLSSGGSRQFDINAVISQLNAEMAMSMMTDFLLVGHEKIGARALATDKRAVFSHAAASFLGNIATVINRFAIPQLVRLNGWHEDLTPTFAHGPVAEIALGELTTFVEKMAGAGVLFPDEDLEKHLRARALLPPPAEGSVFPKPGDGDDPKDDPKPKKDDDEDEE